MVRTYVCMYACISSSHNSCVHTYIRTYQNTYICVHTINTSTSNRTSTPMNLLLIKYTYTCTYIRTCLCSLFMTALVFLPFRMVVQGSMDGSPVPSASSLDGRSYIHTYIHACMWSRLGSPIHLGRGGRPAPRRRRKGRPIHSSPTIG